MKIVYTTVLDQITKAIHKAEKDGRTIEKIELTPIEFFEVVNACLVSPYDAIAAVTRASIHIHGVLCVKVA